MAIELAVKTSPRVVERFKRGSLTEGLFTAEYDWQGVDTVKVYTIDNLTLNDYNRTAVTGSRFGAFEEVGDTVQTMKLTQDKSFNGTIDKGNNTEQLMVKAANKILKQNVDEIIIPEVDKYRVTQLIAGAGTTAVAKQAFTTKTALVDIMSANAAMSNDGVPTAGRVLLMGYLKAVQVKLADQLVNLNDPGKQAIVNGVAGTIDGCQVRLVPDNWLTGKDFMIVKTGCAVAPKKLETFRVIKEDAMLDGSIVQGRIIHDCFVLETKNKGIYVQTSAV